MIKHWVFIIGSESAENENGKKIPRPYHIKMSYVSYPIKVKKKIIRTIYNFNVAFSIGGAGHITVHSQESPFLPKTMPTYEDICAYLKSVGIDLNEWLADFQCGMLGYNQIMRDKLPKMPVVAKQFISPQEGRWRNKANKSKREKTQ